MHRVRVLCASLAILVIIGTTQLEAFANVGGTRYGEITVDPHVYWIERHEENFAKISGKISDAQDRQEVYITVTAPSSYKSLYEIGSNSDGEFEMDYRLEYDSQVGDYYVSARTESGKSMGQVTFEVRKRNLSSGSDLSGQVVSSPKQAIDLEVNTNQPRYYVGDQIIISGNVTTSHTGSFNGDLALLIRAPNSNVIHIEQISIDGEKFVTTMKTSDLAWGMNGTYTIRVNYMGSSAETNFEFYISDPPKQQPLADNIPILNLIPDQIITAGDGFKYVVGAIDKDDNKWTYALSNAPQGATINHSTGTIIWSTNTNDVGVHNFTVDVQDNTITYSRTFSVTAEAASSLQSNQVQSNSIPSTTTTTTPSQSNQVQSNSIPSTTTTTTPSQSNQVQSNSIPSITTTTTPSQSNLVPSSSGSEMIIFVIIFAVIITGIFIAIKRRKSTSKSTQYKGVRVGASPKSRRFTYNIKSNRGNEASTIAYYECPKCHDPNIRNNPDGSARCIKCGFTT